MNSFVNADSISVGLPIVQQEENKMKPRKSTQRERDEAVRRVDEYGESVADVAEDTGWSVSAIQKWRRAKKKALKKENERESERERCRMLEEENRRLVEENDLLKSDVLSLRRVLKSELMGE